MSRRRRRRQGFDQDTADMTVFKNAQSFTTAREREALLPTLYPYRPNATHRPHHIGGLRRN